MHPAPGPEYLPNRKFEDRLGLQGLRSRNHLRWDHLGVRSNVADEEFTNPIAEDS